MSSLARKNVSLWIVVVIVAVMSAVFFVFRDDGVYHYELSVKDKTGISKKFFFGAKPALADTEFYNEIKNQFVSKRISFIEANLSSMEVKVFKEGELVKIAPILAKGKVGSLAQTPPGIYKAKLKSKNHFSSFSHVYMPWSIQFQGNYFIHGWPYTPDGTPISGSNSAGCIRLSVNDAKGVYKLTEIGTPILVFDDSFANDNSVYYMNIPKFNAESYLLADLKNNFIFYEKNSSKLLQSASFAKLVTAISSMDYIPIANKIYVPKHALVGTFIPRLRSGNRYSLYDLFFPLLMESSDEAAETIASSIGEERLVGLMNDKANSIGMDTAKFVDATGKSKLNVVSAMDMFYLAKYVYSSKKFILDIINGGQKAYLLGEPAFKNLKHISIGTPDYWSEGNQNVFSVMELNFGGEKRPVVLVALNVRDETDIGGKISGIRNYLQTAYTLTDKDYLQAKNFGQKIYSTKKQKASILESLW